METSTFNPINLQFDNDDAWDLICNGRTKGVFQLESSLGRSWAKRIKPRNIEDLAALVSIIRPGCLKAIVDGKSMTQHFLDRRNGLEEVEYLHPSLKPILESTQGVLVYQEQSMKIAQQLAGFDLQEADSLRKAIGKKKADLMAKVKKSFLQGSIEQGIVNKETAEEIFSWIEKSSRYAFNKSHAVSYAICGYWSAYAKAYYPLEFYNQYLRFAHGKPNPQQEIKELVRDARALNINIHPPSIKYLNAKNEILEDKVHFGLKDVKSIGDRHMKKLKEELPNIQEQSGKHISEMSWYEFLVYCGDALYGPLVIAMISVGMLSHTKKSRTEMLDNFDTWQKLTSKETEWAKKHCNEHDNLIDLLKALSPTKKMGGGCHNEARSEVVKSMIMMLENPPSSMDDDPSWIINTEENLLGVAISYSRIESSETSMADTKCRDVINGKKGKMRLAITLNVVRKWRTKANKEMAFISAADDTGEIDNIAIFNEDWENYKNILYEGNNVLVFCESSQNRDGIIVSKAVEI